MNSAFFSVDVDAWWQDATEPGYDGNSISKTSGKFPGTLEECTFRVVFVASNHGAGMATEEKADAVIRCSDKPGSVSVSLADIGIPGLVKVRGLWSHEDLGTVVGALTQKINPHGAGLYRVHPQN